MVKRIMGKAVKRVVKGNQELRELHTSRPPQKILMCPGKLGFTEESTDLHRFIIQRPKLTPTIGAKGRVQLISYSFLRSGQSELVQSTND